MGKFSRGSQLGDSQRTAGREQRKQQIAERNKAARRTKSRRFAKRVMIALAVIAVLVIIFDRQFIRYSNSSLDEPYLTTVGNYFSENPIRKSKLLFNPQDLSNYVISKHPEVSEFTTEMSFLSNDEFVIVGRQPTFVWEVNNKSYLGDGNGIIYTTADGSQDKNLPLLKDEAVIEANLGDKVVPVSTLGYLKEIESKLESTDLEPKYYRIPVAAREIHVFFTGKPYFVKFSLDRSVAGQTSELQKAVEFINKSRINVKTYIDLRTEDKAYYQ